jgi:antitoxin ParD1/3/4
MLDKMPPPHSASRSVNVSLTPQLEALVRPKVETGLYRNASEVVHEALLLLDLRDRRISWLRSKMATAQEQVKRGQVIEFSHEFLVELDRDVEDRLRRGDTPSPDVCP